MQPARTVPDQAGTTFWQAAGDPRRPLRLTPYYMVQIPMGHGLTWLADAGGCFSSGAGEACGAELLQAAVSTFFVWGRGMSLWARTLPAKEAPSSMTMRRA